MSNFSISLAYGVMSDPINVQLDNSKYKYNAKKIAVFEKEREAINRLRFGSGLLTDSMVDKILPKLHKKIVAHVAEANGYKLV